jgi:hypothetical protein
MPKILSPSNFSNLLRLYRNAPESLADRYLGDILEAFVTARNLAFENIEIPSDEELPDAWIEPVIVRFPATEEGEADVFRFLKRCDGDGDLNWECVETGVLYHSTGTFWREF